MTDQHQHRATPEQWATTERRGAGDYATSSCLLELPHRIQLLEAIQHAHIEWARTAPGMRSDDQMLALEDQIRDGALTLADALKDINGEPEPAADSQPLTMLKQVTRAIYDTPYGRDGCQDSEAEARAAIRAIAAWLRRWDAGASITGGMVANLLDNEANR